MCSLTNVLFLFCALFYLVNAATFTTAASSSIQGPNPTSHALSTDDDNTLKGKKSWERCRDETCKSMVLVPHRPYSHEQTLHSLLTTSTTGLDPKKTTAKPPSTMASLEEKDSNAICNRVCSIWGR
ncbi:hypothetical protein DDE82_005955 [Stemphylium lycopersici]|nr:hypothetical protein TW65_01914 [Stemphylium lycopersici]RAR02238.1 hypothetical protein DDE82_005955 [Stemphylium lycopersici]